MSIISRNFQNIDFSAISTLDITYDDAEPFFIKSCSRVSNRFMDKAATLSDEGFIGCQFFMDEEKRWSTVFFTNPESELTLADFNWIFQGCKTFESFSTTIPEDLYQGDRIVYAMLQPYPEESEDLIGDTEYMYTLTELFENENAMIRIIAGSSDKEEESCGMVLISLPKKMSVKMKQTLVGLFPMMMIKKIPRDHDPEDPEPYIAQIFVYRHLFDYLYQLIHKRGYEDVVERQSYTGLHIVE